MVIEAYTSGRRVIHAEVYCYEKDHGKQTLGVHYHLAILVPRPSHIGRAQSRTRKIPRKRLTQTQKWGLGGSLEHRTQITLHSIVS